MQHLKQLFFLGIAALWLCACNLDTKPVTYLYDNVVVAVNQGNFAERNGTLSYYHEGADVIENNVLKEANKYDLGALIQSITISNGGVLYVICNTPDKVEVFDVVTKKALTTTPFTENLSNPRYAALDDNYLYISNWGEGVDDGTGWLTYPNSYVLAVSLISWSVSEKILCGSDAEEIIFANNKLYVATGEGVAVISELKVEKTIAATSFVGGAKHLVKDKNEKVWVSYPGEGLLQINPSTETAESEYVIPIDWLGQIASNYDRSKIYTYNTTFDNNYTAQGAAIYEFDVATRTHKTFAEGDYFYSIGASPYTGNVYTAEVNNFAGNSELLVFDAQGEKVANHLIGVGTCDYRYFRITGEE
jgi:hypothetical protein